MTQDFSYQNKEFEETKKLRNGKFRNYYCCPFTNLKYDSPVHSKDAKPRYMKTKEKGKHSTSLDHSSISIKINDANLISPFTSKNNKIGYSDTSNTEDRTSAMFKLSTITNLNPHEMRKINYNPYKKRENQIADPNVLSYLKEISQKESNVVRKNEKFTGRFLDKLKKKREVDFKSNNNQLSSLSSKVINGVKTESNNNLVHEKYEIESELKNNPIDYFKTYRNPNLRKTTDDKVFIDNHEYPKTNLNDISKKVLERCKFTHCKSKNANTSLKVGDGKLMITNGMTVSEFSKNYHLNA